MRVAIPPHIHWIRDYATPAKNHQARCILSETRCRIHITAVISLVIKSHVPVVERLHPAGTLAPSRRAFAFAGDRALTCRSSAKPCSMISV